MVITDPKIYLASQSPRRRELLKQIGVNYGVLLLRSGHGRGVDVDETPLEQELPDDYVVRICRAKAEAGYKMMLERAVPQFPVLAADTIVALDNQIVGKPKDEADARAMLQAYSGRSHQVITGVAMFDGKNLAHRVVKSAVEFCVLSDAQIDWYLRTNEYVDKAGAYAIQGHASIFIKQLHGSYSCVMGLPLYETAELLRTFHYPIP